MKGEFDAAIARPYRSHEEATIESFRRDPVYAAEYLRVVLAEGDARERREALRRCREASRASRSPARSGRKSA